MTFDPGTWWLVVGLLGLGGTALAFLLKRNMTESDRTKDRVTELEARSAQKSDVDKALEKVNKTVAEQGKAISHIEKTYVEKDELQAVRKELREETRKLQADIEDHSDRKGMHIEIDIKRDASPQIVLNQLFSGRRGDPLAPELQTEPGA